MKHQSPTNHGFTLIETLVAITILIIGVLGPLSLAARGITDGLYVQNELAANYLGQEAMETITSSRNALIGDPNNPASWSEWLATLPTSCTTADLNGASACGINVDTGAVVSGCADSAAPCNVQFADVNNNDSSHSKRYVAAGTLGTVPLGPIFQRWVYLTLLPQGSDSTNSTELKVTVVLHWFNKNIPRTIVFTQHLSPRQS